MALHVVFPFRAGARNACAMTHVANRAGISRQGSRKIPRAHSVVVSGARCCALLREVSDAHHNMRQMRHAVHDAHTRTNAST